MANTTSKGVDPAPEKEVVTIHDVAKNMLLNEDVVVKRIFTQKKINKTEDEIRKIVEDLNHFIYYFNTIDETQTTVFFQHIDPSKVYIPREFADFIIPAAVRRDSTDRRCKNLIEVESVTIAVDGYDRNVYENYIEYMNVVDSYRSIFKSDMMSNTVALSELKKSVNVESVIDRLCTVIGGTDMVRYSGEPFVPLKLQVVGDEFEKRYFTNTASEVMTDWYANLRFN